jgi:hypothetical protein
VFEFEAVELPMRLHLLLELLDHVTHAAAGPKQEAAEGKGDD